MSDLVFSCASPIACTSKYFTLRPSDIVFNGTPEGVIAGSPGEK